ITGLNFIDLADRITIALSSAPKPKTGLGKKRLTIKADAIPIMSNQRAAQVIKVLRYLHAIVNPPIDDIQKMLTYIDSLIDADKIANKLDPINLKTGKTLVITLYTTLSARFISHNNRLFIFNEGQAPPSIKKRRDHTEKKAAKNQELGDIESDDSSDKAAKSRRQKKVPIYSLTQVNRKNITYIDDPAKADRNLIYPENDIIRGSKKAIKLRVQAIVNPNQPQTKAKLERIKKKEAKESPVIIGVDHIQHLIANDPNDLNALQLSAEIDLPDWISNELREILIYKVILRDIFSHKFNYHNKRATNLGYIFSIIAKIVLYNLKLN
ncbi:hypothetical protein HG531_014132, partial [Fusarium graminearum]